MTHLSPSRVVSGSIRAVALSIALAATVCAPAVEARTFGRIAVLDLERAFRESTFCTTRIEELNVQRKRADAEVLELDQTIRRDQNELTTLDRSSQRYAEISERVAVGQARRQEFVRRIREDIDRRYVAVVKGGYGIIRDHLREFAVAKGIKLVHLAPSEELTAATMQELQLQLGLQAVLFADESLEITEPFIHFVNTELAEDEAKLSAAAKEAAAQAPPAGGAQGGGHSPPIPLRNPDF